MAYSATCTPDKIENDSKEDDPNKTEYNPNKRTVHHLVPRSRQFNRSFNEVNNTKRVSDLTHIAWHRLFVNRMPHEVLQLIICMAPDGYFISMKADAHWEYSNYNICIAPSENHISKDNFLRHKIEDKELERMRAWDIVFSKKDFFECAVEVVLNWTAQGYYSKVIIIARDGRKYVIPKRK